MAVVLWGRGSSKAIFICLQRKGTGDLRAKKRMRIWMHQTYIYLLCTGARGHSEGLRQDHRPLASKREDRRARMWRRSCAKTLCGCVLLCAGARGHSEGLWQDHRPLANKREEGRVRIWIRACTDTPRSCPDWGIPSICEGVSVRRDSPLYLHWYIFIGIYWYNTKIYIYIYIYYTDAHTHTHTYTYTHTHVCRTASNIVITL